MFDLFKANFPELAELVVFRELSTPLATASITGHHEGRFYGLDGTPERVMSDALRTRTPIDGLFCPGRTSSVRASKVRFRAGFLVSKENAEKAEGDVKADVLPAGKVLNYVHEGPYAKLRVSYDEAMKYISQNGMIVGEPTWEIYLNEPDDVETEDRYLHHCQRCLTSVSIAYVPWYRLFVDMRSCPSTIWR
ncbi:hypothetical protein C1J03_23395 (plasmid) [Sulfitobacter sp. SK012]|uniref:GyrI-like domain-containing protein n=1 Tax=Sulfitobacter sp. SK012 TaxID=1389005 RepID=UPI000E0B622A|nr:GyrI-like domain-containing protein [Sulfitobacter sp. SK012]AXI49076.1 hypothetical protein C1J03_23395 [Sulfitobacter sp. SK012]